MNCSREGNQLKSFVIVSVQNTILIKRLSCILCIYLLILYITQCEMWREQSINKAFVCSQLA